MRTFVAKIALFVFPIVLVAIAMELLLRAIPNDFEYKKACLKEKASTIETLIIGNSHTLYGLDPEFFDGNVFNLSQVSQSPDLDQIVLEHFMPAMPNLKTLIIRLSYDSTFEQLQNSNESWRLKNYYLYYGVPENVAVVNKFEILAVSMKFNLKRLWNYYIKDMPGIEVTQSGFGMTTYQDLKPDLETTGPIAAKRHTSDTAIYFEENKKIYEAIILDCKKKGIEVVLVTLPTYKSYYNNLNTKQLNSTVVFGETQHKKYDNVTYYNLLKDASFDETDFFDADHLNEKGAKKLSMYLNTVMGH